MAEVVQRKLEAMLPELEELQRVGLFTRDEVQAVVRKRRTFEYRMLRRPADKEAFLQAIQVDCAPSALQRVGAHPFMCVCLSISAVRAQLGHVAGAQKEGLLVMCETNRYID